MKNQLYIKNASSKNAISFKLTSLLITPILFAFFLFSSFDSMSQCTVGANVLVNRGDIGFNDVFFENSISGSFNAVDAIDGSRAYFDLATDVLILELPAGQYMDIGNIITITVANFVGVAGAHNFNVEFSADGTTFPNLINLISPSTTYQSVTANNDVANARYVRITMDTNGDDMFIDFVSAAIINSELDTDGDCLSDRQETFEYGTNPNVADTDGDGTPDQTEILAGTSPTCNETTSVNVANGLLPLTLDNGSVNMTAAEITNATSNATTESLATNEELSIQNPSGELFNVGDTIWIIADEVVATNASWLEVFVSTDCTTYTSLGEIEIIGTTDMNYAIPITQDDVQCIKVIPSSEAAVNVNNIYVANYTCIPNSGPCMINCYTSDCAEASGILEYKESFEEVETNANGTNIPYNATNVNYFKGYGGTLTGLYLPENDGSELISGDDVLGNLSPDLTVFSSNNSSNDYQIVTDADGAATGNVPDGSNALHFKYNIYGGLTFAFPCSDFEAGKRYYISADIGLGNDRLNQVYMQPILVYSDTQGGLDSKTFDFEGITEDFQEAVFSFCAPQNCSDQEQCKGNSGTFSFTLSQTSNGEMGIIIDNIRIWKSDCNITTSPGESSCYAVCDKDTGTIDLFDQLGGTPTSGGIWTDPDGAVTSSTYDLDSEVYGEFSYTIPDSADGCDLTSTVEVAPGNIIFNEGFEATSGTFNAARNGQMTVNASSQFKGYGYGTTCTVATAYHEYSNASSAINSITPDDDLGLAQVSISTTGAAVSDVVIYRNDLNDFGASSCLENEYGNNALGLRGGAGMSDDASINFEFDCGAFLPGYKYYFAVEVGYDNTLTTNVGATGLSLDFATDLGASETATFNFAGTSETQERFFSFCPPAACGDLCNSGSFNLTLTRPGDATKGGLVLDNIRIYQSSCNITSTPGIDNSVAIEVCVGDPDFDLFDSLLGSPDNDGVWSDITLTNGTQATFVTTSNYSGVYSYSVVSECGCEMTACVQVNVNPTPAAPAVNYIPGFNYVAVCVDATEVALEAACKDNYCREGALMTKEFTFTGPHVIDENGANQSITLTGVGFPAGYEIVTVDALELEYLYGYTGSNAYNMCDNGTRNSYYASYVNYIDFDLITPGGTRLGVVDRNDYNGGWNPVFRTQNYITTTFVDDQDNLATGIPANGTFGAPGSDNATTGAVAFSSVAPAGETASGTYSLDFSGSVVSNRWEYCIAKATVTITAQPRLMDELTQWYPSDLTGNAADQTASPLDSDSMYDPITDGQLNTSTPSETKWWTTCSCDGCESDPQASTVYVIGHTNITATQVCDLTTTTSAESEDYSIKLCFDVPVQGPTPKYEVELLRPGAVEPLTFGILNYADRDADGCVILTSDVFDARDLETGIEISIKDRDVTSGACSSILFNEVSCCSMTTPQPAFDIPALVCGENFPLNPINNNANTIATAVGVWSGSGANLVVGSATPGGAAVIDSDKLINMYTYKLIYTITGGDGCYDSVEQEFMLDKNCSADAGKF